MRRWIVTIPVCLLLGAIVNVAVAWGLSVIRARDWTPTTTMFWSSQPGFKVVGGASSCTGGMRLVAMCEREFVPANMRRDFVDAYTYGFVGDPLPSWAVPSLIRIDPDMGASQRFWVSAYGWPCISLFAEIKQWGQGGPMKVRPMTGIPVSNAPPLMTALPLRPIWPGFAINTIFYAAILLGLWMTPFAIRRMIRRRRGRCASCGYDLRGHATNTKNPHPQPLSQGERGVKCPECGAAAS